MNATTEKTNANGNGCADVKESSGTDGGDGNGNEKPTISSDVSLPNDVLERLFQRYSIKQRRAGLECFLVTSILFDLWVILAPEQGKTIYNIGMCTSCYVMLQFFLLPLVSFSIFFIWLPDERLLLNRKINKTQNLIKVLCSPLEFSKIRMWC